MTEYTHLHPDIRSVMEKSDQERIRFIEEPRWVGYDKAKKIMEILVSLLDRPKKPRMDNLLIIGDSNNGKTTLIQRFYHLHGHTTQDENQKTLRPIILVEAPPRADDKSLYIAILKQFFTIYRPTDSVDKLSNQVLHLCAACQVKMLIIDEMHSLLTATANKQRVIMNTIKYLSNQLQIPIIGVGTKDAMAILNTDPQHASRFMVADLDQWELNREFAILLSSFESLLPLKKPSLLKNKESASLIFSISGGNLGNAHTLLKECAKDAIKSGKEQIDLDLIQNNDWIRPTKGIRSILN